MHQWSNPQSNISSSAVLLWYCFTSLGDWSRKLLPFFQPIGFKTETKRDFDQSWFPALGAICVFSLRVLLGYSRKFFLATDWMLWLVGLTLFTLNGKALCITIQTRDKEETWQPRSLIMLFWCNTEYSLLSYKEMYTSK